MGHPRYHPRHLRMDLGQGYPGGKEDRSDPGDPAFCLLLPPSYYGEKQDFEAEQHPRYK